MVREFDAHAFERKNVLCDALDNVLVIEKRRGLIGR